jgi:hypothetical protein
MPPGEQWRVFNVDEFKPPADTEIPPDAPAQVDKKRK